MVFVTLPLLSTSAEVMIADIVTSLSAGEAPAIESDEFKAAIEDRDFRIELVTAVAQSMGLADELDLEEPEVKMLVDSSDHIADFLNSMQMVAAMAEEMQAGLTPSSTPAATEADLRPAPANMSSSDLDQAMELVGRSFFVESAWGGNAQVAGDFFHLPNAELAEVEMSWQSLVTPGGDQPLASDAVDPNDPFSQSRIDSDGNWSQRVAIGEMEDDDVRGLRGQVTVTVPVSFESAQFTSEDVGGASGTRPLGGATATLESCQNDVATVRVEGAFEGTPLVIARDAEGTRLGSSESMTETRAGWKATMRFAGTIGSVEVLLTKESATREVDCLATREPKNFQEGSVTVEVARYNRPRPSLRYEQITSSALTENVTIVAGRLSSAFEFNHPMVHCHLPEIDNSALAEVEFGEPTVVDASGTVVDCEMVGRGYEGRFHCERISFEKDSAEPEGVARIRGTVSMTYPRVIDVVTFEPAESEKNGYRVRFEGARIAVTGSEDDSPFGQNWLGGGWSDGPRRIEAFDAEGRSLRRLSYSGYEDGAHVFAFWGEPASVRLLTVPEWETIELPYDVASAPRLAEELAGTNRPETQCRGVSSLDMNRE